MLDRRLASWRTELGIFPDPIAEALGPLVQRLAAAIGRFGSSSRAGADPDGFDGVATRGPYDRLLASEWLLASEAPDEFLRRAAMGEHLFTKLARREPLGGTRSIVVFDAGPSQLGSPRLVHLVLLLVLRYRARAAGADFRWCVLQQPDKVRSEADADAIRFLLGARSPFLPRRDDVEDLGRSLRLGQGGDDLWWIGGAHLHRCSSHLAGARVYLNDDLCPGGDRLGVVIERSGGKRELVLELPGPMVRTQLVRNPFEEPRRVVLPGAAGRYRFSTSAKHLLVEDAQGFAAFHVSSRRLQRHRVDGQLIGANFAGRYPAVLSCEGQKYVLRLGQTTVPVEPEGLPIETAPDQWGDLFVLGKRERRVLYRDVGGTVFAGVWKEPPLRLRPVLDRVVELVHRHGHFDYVRRSSGGAGSVELGRLGLDGVAAKRAEARSAEPPRVLVGSARGSYSQARVLAVQIPVSERHERSGLASASDVLWELWEFDTPGTLVLVASASLQAVGLVKTQVPSDWRLLVVSENRLEFGILEGGLLTPLFRADGLVESCVLADEGHRLAFRTPAGLSVLDLQSRTALPVRVSREAPGLSEGT